MALDGHQFASPFAFVVLVTVCLFVFRLIRRDDYEDSIRWGKIALSTQGDAEAFERLVAKAVEAKSDAERLPWWLGDLAFCLVRRGREAEANETWQRARDLMFQNAGDADVRPAEFLEFWAMHFEGSPWHEAAGAMRNSATELRAKVAATVDAAFPGRRMM